MQVYAGVGVVSCHSSLEKKNNIQRHELHCALCPNATNQKDKIDNYSLMTMFHKYNTSLICTLLLCRAVFFSSLLSTFLLCGAFVFNAGGYSSLSKVFLLYRALFFCAELFSSLLCPAFFFSIEHFSSLPSIRSFSSLSRILTSMSSTFLLPRAVLGRASKYK